MSAPETVNLTAAAIELVAQWDDGYVMTSQGGMQVWRALTGLPDNDEALAYARELVLAPHPTTAHIPPL